MIAMDENGDLSHAAAMGTIIFYTNALVRISHSLAARGFFRKAQTWRTR